ncbi:MAG: peptidoglycan DD-metalloendopeptidase family protein [Bacteroidota bacterium]|nr:peptidoglycan DD-metalloendopeptidase family protein [Bacteroidota bacterium]
MNLIGNDLYNQLRTHSGSFDSIINFDPDSEKIIHIDLTENNKDLHKIDIKNTELFSQYIFKKLKDANAKFAIGGYDELRTVYSVSDLFNNDLSVESTGETGEPRRLHLGTDIWGNEGTKVFAPLDGTIHSFAFNDHFGDYGATIILFHCLGEISFYTLYGHVSLRDIENIRKGDSIKKGQLIAHFGNILENGHWPPHLHFQVIKEIGSYEGDYPGVCQISKRELYLKNCPDPDIILGLKKYLL